MKLLMATIHSRVRRSGFTLVELLIVISVITILSAVAIVSYIVVQANARDTQRAADVSTIMDALEKYYQQNGEYPADDTLNPSHSTTRLPNFSAVESTLPGLTDDDLTGPGDYQFYAACMSSGCSSTASNWQNYMTKSYRYQSRYSGTTTAGSSFATSVAATYGGNGWGCTVTTYYDDPGYVISWYDESKKVWIFKKSLHGNVTIASYGSGPVAPQTCAFS